MRIDNISNLTGLLPGSATRPGMPGADFGAALRNASEASGDIFTGGALGDVADNSAISGSGFGATIGQALQNVNSLQAGADTMAQKLATGDVQNVHEVMLALNQASMAFDLTAQVRNKVVEAYQEVMRMQV